MGTIQKLLTYWAQLLGANVFSLFCSLLGGIVVARAVDVATLGIFTIIQGLVRLIDGTVAVQPYSTVIRFGVRALTVGQPPSFGEIFRITFIIEGLSKCLAFAVAVAVIMAFAPRLGVPDEARSWAMAYAFVIPTGVTGSAMAALRLFDKYFLGSLPQIVGGALRLTATVLCALAHAPVFLFLLGWIITEMATNVMVVAFAWREVRRRGHADVMLWGGDRPARSHPEIRSSLLAATLTNLLRSSTEQGDVLLVGAFFGPTVVGYLRIAKSVSSLLAQFGWPIHYVISPTLQRYWITRNASGVAMIVIGVIAGGTCCVLATTLIFGLEGGTIIRVLYGEKYVPAAGIATVYICAYSLMLIGAPIEDSVFALGRPSDYTRIHLVGTCVFALSVYILLPYCGWITTGLGHIFYITSWLVLGYVIIFRGFSRINKPFLDAD